MNNKGFTLVELLAVLAILVAIMGVAIPSISSSLERTKEKQNTEKQELLESFAELYVSDHKNAIYNKYASGKKCYIAVSTLIDEGYFDASTATDADGNEMNGYIVYTRPSTYEYETSVSGVSACV